MPATSSVVRFPKHLRYGDLVFDTNTLLSKVALRSGDRKNAARHLFAAAETPGSDRLRYNPISIELPARLSTGTSARRRMVSGTLRPVQ